MARDYAAEYARRNARAKAAGAASYGKLRRAKEVKTNTYADGKKSIVQTAVESRFVIALRLAARLGKPIGIVAPVEGGQWVTILPRDMDRLLASDHGRDGGGKARFVKVEGRVPQVRTGQGDWGPADIRQLLDLIDSYGMGVINDLTIAAMARS